MKFECFTKVFILSVSGKARKMLDLISFGLLASMMISYNWLCGADAAE